MRSSRTRSPGSECSIPRRVEVQVLCGSIALPCATFITFHCAVRTLRVQAFAFAGNARPLCNTQACLCQCAPDLACNAVGGEPASGAHRVGEAGRKSRCPELGIYVGGESVEIDRARPRARKPGGHGVDKANLHRNFFMREHERRRGEFARTPDTRPVGTFVAHRPSCEQPGPEGMTACGMTVSYLAERFGRLRIELECKVAQRHVAYRGIGDRREKTRADSEADLQDARREMKVGVRTLQKNVPRLRQRSVTVVKMLAKTFRPQRGAAVGSRLDRQRLIHQAKQRRTLDGVERLTLGSSNPLAAQLACPCDGGVDDDFLTLQSATQVWSAWSVVGFSRP